MLNLSDYLKKSQIWEAGTGNILGGYSVPATAYNSSTHVMTLSETTNGYDTDMTKFTVGSTVYISDVENDDDTEGTWGSYRSAVISAVDAENFTLTFTEDIGITTSTTLDTIAVMVVDTNRIDIAVSTGDRNFVTGDAASAGGLINTVCGIASHAEGSMNYVSGAFSASAGVGNKVTGDRSFAYGGGNSVSSEMSTVFGNGNVVDSQGAVVLGLSNRDVTGVDARIVGDGNKISGARSIAVGTYNTVSGDDSLVIGSGSTVAAKKAVLIGRRAQLADTAENTGAVAIGGGDVGDGSHVVSFIHRSRKADALADDGTAVCFAHEYRGRLVAMTETISDTGTITLDHDQYARWKLTGTGSITVTLANWIDGDYGELVLDSSIQTLTVPANWVMDSSIWNDWQTTQRVHCLEIRQEDNTIFARAIL